MMCPLEGIDGVRRTGVRGLGGFVDTSSLSVAASPRLAALLREPLPSAAARFAEAYDAHAKLLEKDASTKAMHNKFSLGSASKELAARALAASLEKDPALLDALLRSNKGKHGMASLVAAIASRGPERGGEVPEGAGVYAHTLEVYEKEYSDKALARARACMGERAVRLAAVEAGAQRTAPPGCAPCGWQVGGPGAPPQGGDGG